MDEGASTSACAAYNLCLLLWLLWGASKKLCVRRCACPVAGRVTAENTLPE